MCSLWASPYTPEPIEIRDTEAWKYGLKSAYKSVQGWDYFSITINEELLCQPSSIEFKRFFKNGGFSESEVYIGGDSYATKTILEGYRAAMFEIKCVTESQVHRSSHFIYWVYRNSNA
ncbi:hypothetical protein SAMN02745866_00725 [Alteromonadaceae bacterium Bs31]|nr:hypothetical protein SAMN02745866_00725 [Alteromonadaceae bacterium Bs31]